MNKVVYKDESKNIPGFAEALEEDRENFMWDILNLMDRLYKVLSISIVFNPNKTVLILFINLLFEFNI